MVTFLLEGRVCFFEWFFNGMDPAVFSNVGHFKNRLTFMPIRIEPLTARLWGVQWLIHFILWMFKKVNFNVFCPLKCHRHGAEWVWIWKPCLEYSVSYTELDTSRRHNVNSSRSSCHIMRFVFFLEFNSSHFWDGL